VLDKEGIKAITNFVAEWEGKPHKFSLEDPVTLKGKNATQKVITELESQIGELKSLNPPQRWVLFHQRLTDSLSLQLEGYREMLKIFLDRDPKHLTAGQEKINQGMGLLTARAKLDEN